MNIAQEAMPLACDYAATDGRHLAEIDGDLLTICRASDGRAINFHGRQFCKAFRDSVKGSGAAAAIRVYIKLAPYQAAGRDGRFIAPRPPAITSRAAMGARRPKAWPGP